MDVGFKSAGVDVVWANDFDKNACDTYAANHSSIIRFGDIRSYLKELSSMGPLQIVFGGPPCQGFSVAGKMDPSDPRSSLLWEFIKVVEITKPNVFVCENVKGLGTLEKWENVRKKFVNLAYNAGYDCSFIILNSKDYGVPQSRERVFFIGSRSAPLGNLELRFKKYKTISKSLRELLQPLGRAGSKRNSRICNAKITLATNPILRRSPYSGMLFNGLGRPMRLDGVSATLPASMGGNKTPIIDEDELYNGKKSWVEAYHSKLIKKQYRPKFRLAPKRLRRITIDEALRIQTFPEDYLFKGSNSSIYRQIGNAVPCELAKAVAKVAIDLLDHKEIAQPLYCFDEQQSIMTI